VNHIIREDIERIVSAPLPWDEFSGANILISGGAGFLPAYMVETLMYLNHHRFIGGKPPCTVSIIVRNKDRAEQRFPVAGFGSGFYSRLFILEGDVCEPLSRRYDYIIHAASQASPRFYQTDPVGTLSANTLGTANMLEVARRSASKGFLFFSSGDAAYPINPTKVRSCYSESKRMGETMCVAWANQFGVPAKIVRISHTYGPGMKLDDGRVFADFTRDIVNGGPIVLHSDGSAERPFLYVSEATTAFFTVLLKGKVAEPENVANPYQFMKISELADRLATTFGMRVERRERQDSAYAVSPLPGVKPPIGRLIQLGWHPEITVEEGFWRTVESYVEAS